MGEWIKKRRDSYILPLILVGALVYPGWTKQGDAFADQKGEAAAPQNERGAQLLVKPRNITRHWRVSHCTSNSWADRKTSPPGTVVA